LTDVLGPRHVEVQRLRALLRDRRTRSAERAFVLEGPRVIDGALDRGARLDAIYLGSGAMRAFAPLVQRAVATGARVAELKEGVLEKVGTTRTPQPVLAVATMAPVALDDLAGHSASTGPGVRGTLIVTVDIADPGNLGTIIRSAEAAGAAGVVACGNSVDLYNPKVVRSSAGAMFGMTVVEQGDPMATLDALGERSWRRLGTRAAGGDPYDEVDLVDRCALVVGNEAHGLAPDLDARLDGTITIPLREPAESLNVAMAATVLCFEAARQRRATGVRP
jgi:TrmH family RNA methyltransferase